MRVIRALVSLVCALAGIFFCTLPAEAQLYLVAGGGRNYQNVVVVAKSGSPYTSVQAALDAISGAGDSNRYLIYVAPGTYTGRFTMEPYVDIAGSGPNVTILQAPGGATCTAADNATLSDLTVKNTGGDTVGIALFSYGVSPTILRVRAEAAGAAGNNYGMYFYTGIPNIKDSTSLVSDAGAAINYAAMNVNSHATYQNCDLGAFYGTQAYGMSNSGGEVNLQNCRLLAESATTYNYGMKNMGLGADVLIRHCQIAANGDGAPSSTQYGLYNINGTSVKMFSGQVEARNGSSTHGVTNESAGADDPVEAFFAYRCSIQATSGAVSNIGVYSTGDSSDKKAKAYLNQCDVEGATNSVANGAFVDTYLGASWLNGPTDAGTDFATMTCAGCYGASYNFGAGSCP